MGNSNLVQLVKRIAIEAVNASKPCDYIIGTVTKENPLEIKISQSITIDEDFLCLIQSIIENPLKQGEKVLMFRKAGGQEYVVIDRVVS